MTTTLRILIIDDEELLLRAWSRLLGRQHRVSIAHGGAAGLRALEELGPGERFDAVLLDLSMPDIDGIDLFEVARRRWRWFADRVVLLTGGTSDARRAEFVATCGRPQLLKPFSRDELDAMLVRLGAAPALEACASA